MGSFTDVVECPKCGYYNEETGEGFIVDTYTNGEEFAGCQRCDYGYMIIYVPVCKRCGEKIWKLLPSIDDLDLIDGLRHCPICNSPFIMWELEFFDNHKCHFVKIPISKLRPISELIDYLKVDKKRKVNDLEVVDMFRCAR
jgi:hypothetical protein